jgi:hypothetical protein
MGCVLWLTGCGSVETTETEEQPVQNAQAVVSAACKAESLSWPAGSTADSYACAGPQELSFKCFNQKTNDSRCPQTGSTPRPKTCYQTCDVVTGFHEEADSSELLPDGYYLEQICECDTPRCDYQYCYDVYHYTFQPASCDTAASAHAARAMASGYTLTGSRWPDDSVNRPFQCNYQLHDVPTVEQASDSRCSVRQCRPEEYEYDPVYGTCRHPAFGAASVGSCGAAASPFLSASGRSVGDLKQDTQIRASWNAMNGASTPVPVEFASTQCLTCEQISNPFDKIQCLRTQLNRLNSLGLSPSARDALEQQLIHHMKLLFETSSDALVIEQRNTVSGYYASKPSITSQCGSAWTAPTTPSCTVPDYVKGTFAMCNQMRSEHVPLAVLPTVFDTCFNLLASYVSGLSPSCSSVDAEQYRQSYVDVSTAIVAKYVGTLSTPVGNSDAEDLARSNELHGKLKAIQTWYSPIRGSIYPGSAPNDATMARVNEVFKRFWNAVYLDKAAEQVINSNTTDAQAEAIRLGVLDQGLRAERQVLRATFARASNPEPPLTGDLVMYVMGDALEGLRRRLEDVSALHDMGCRFMSCTLLRSKTRQLWGLLGSLHDQSALSAELSAIGQLSADKRLDTKWVEVFTNIQFRYDIFLSGARVALNVGSGSYNKDLWFSRAPSALPGTATAFTSLLKTAHARTVGYDTNTLFVLSDARQLEMGLDAQKQANINTEVDQQTASLLSRTDSYKTDRKFLVQGLLSQLENQQALTNVTAQMESLYTQTVDISGDLDGLRGSQAIDEVRHGQFMKSFELLNAGLAAEGRDVVKSEQSLSISAQRATYTGQGGVTDLSDVVVPGASSSPFKLEAQQGDVIDLQVTGQWSPTCALSQTTGFNGSKVKPVNSNQTAAMTGPEGFAVTTSEGNYYAQGVETVNSDGKYNNSVNSAKVCAGLTFAKPIAALSEFLGFSVKAEACSGFDAGDTWNKTESNTNGNGSESRSTLTMARGLRAKRTPFPDQPAGSLLLVRVAHPTAPGSSIPASSILSVQVVRAPSTSVLVDTTSDVYLVVNDLSGSSCSVPNPAALTVKVSHLRSEAAAARQIFTAMALAEKKVQMDARTYVAQGRLLPSQATLLRNSAYDEVYKQCLAACPAGQSCACNNLSVYSESLRNLFETWLTYDLVGIEREVEIVNIERRMRALHLDLKGLEKNYSLVQEKSRLLALEPAWLLRNLDGSELRIELGKLTYLMSNLVEPVMKLRHQELRTSLQVDRAKLEALIDFNPLTFDLVDLSTKATSAAKAINDQLKSERSRGPTGTMSEIIVSIPRVDKGISSDFPSVSNQVAAGIWAQILAGKDPVITLSPADVYAPGGGPLLLGCTQSAPIINTMAFYLVHNVTASYLPYSLTTTFAPEMSFPTTSQLYEYSFVRSDYLAPTVQMILGYPENVLSSLHTYWQTPGTQVATGLSPFSSIHTDLRSFRTRYPNNPDGSIGSTNPLYLADELLIAFRVEPRQESPGAKLPGVLGCN